MKRTPSFESKVLSVRERYLGRASRLLAVGACLLGACGAPGTEEQVAAEESPLYPGTLGGFSAIGKVDLATGCTATMITQRTFITAANCMGPLQPAMRSGGSIRLGTHSYPVDRTFRLGTGYGADDVAVGHLANALPFGVTITTPDIATAPPAINTWLTAYGWGCTGPDRLQQCNPGQVNYVEWFFNGGNSNILNIGDIGGPWLVGRRILGPVARISSTWAGPGGGLAGAQHDVFSDPTKFRDQIFAMDTALNGGGMAYRASVQGGSTEYQSPVSNGVTAGTTGQSLRLEQIQIWSQVPGVVPIYRAISNGAWQPEASDGNVIGSRGATMQALQIHLAPGGPFIGVEYRVHVQNIGWQPWIDDVQICTTNAQCETNFCDGGRCVAGTNFTGLRIEAVEINGLQ